MEREEAIGAIIRRLYLARGYNRNSFAKKINAAYTTVLDWERHGATPGWRKLQDIIGALDLNQEERAAICGGKPMPASNADDDDAASLREELRAAYDRIKELEEMVDKIHTQVAAAHFEILCFKTKG